MNEVVRRPGGRSARVRRQVLDATRELLIECDLESVTIPEVAARAGVHYSSIYRNWTDRGVLLRDALLDLVAGVAPVPDTGDLEADLLELTDGVLDLYQTPVGRILLSTTRSAEEALVDFRSAYWDLRLEALSAIIDRAVDRGEVPPTSDRRLIFEMILGPILSRQLLLGSELTDLSSRTIVDLVLPGLRGQEHDAGASGARTDRRAR
ncbi:TetR/AcrR family transcriptional regulator [Tsukamurella pseudospumae]|uniref:HTH tetR-type domain-containing protein n=1 Tax=Tsukamurella pseudospumae TaxID=239498 RepID=A0A138AJ75_9ACTN|nr:TetR/AcrR family transcriptional regulator [Tsukamurella pseudospumae]KXO96170.1 hypothetical protein AXK61_23365 [Tsukamurella pseudospumae]KXP10442.1 hypothetical protein AXK60_08350 [Tsukamurella pseudospumae]